MRSARAHTTTIDSNTSGLPSRVPALATNPRPTQSGDVSSDSQNWHIPGRKKRNKKKVERSTFEARDPSRTSARLPKQGQQRETGPRTTTASVVHAQNRQNHSALKPKPHDHRRAHALRSGTENGTGVETFRQLQYYSRNGADAAYVLDLALRIQDLARLRAISQYLITNKQLIGPKSSRQRQAEKWHASIKPPADIRHLVSEWDCDNEEDVDGHAQVLNRWLVTERVNQTELERRLATFKYSKL